MDRSRFIHQSAQIRVFEKGLLSKMSFDRLINSDNLSETLRLLSDTVYQSYIQKLDRDEDYELVLSRYTKDLYNQVYKLSDEDKVVDLLALKYLYHNLKVIVKEEILKEDLSDLYIDIGDFDSKDIKDSIDGNVSAKNKKYVDVINSALKSYEENKDPQLIDILIDKKYFEDLINTSKELEIELFIKYVKDMVDFFNIKTLLRCKLQDRDLEFTKKVLVDGGNIEVSKFSDYFHQEIQENSPLFKNTRIVKAVNKGIKGLQEKGSLYVYEKEEENYYIELLKEAKSVTYGPEVVFSYLFAREIEIKNLRIILTSKLNSLPVEFISERLRDSYV